MSRIRTIKPEILEDEAAAALPSDAWRLWVSMWTMADDAGRLRASDKFLRAKVFWALPTVDFPTALAELVSGGFVQLYKVRGQWFAQLRNWPKHQRIEKPQPAKYPGPEEAEEVSTIADVPGGTFVSSVAASESSPTVPGTFPERSRNGPGTFPVGKEGKGEEGNGGEGPPPSAIDPSEEPAKRPAVAMYAEAYAEGQREASGGAPFPPPNKPWDHGAIARFTQTPGWGHGLRGQELLDAIRQWSRDFRRACDDRPKANKNFAPEGCEEWARGSGWRYRPPRMPQEGRSPPKTTSGVSEAPMSLQEAKAAAEAAIAAVGKGAA